LHRLTDIEAQELHEMTEGVDGKLRRERVKKEVERLQKVANGRHSLTFVAYFLR